MKAWKRRDWMKTAALGAGAAGLASTGLHAVESGNSFAADFGADWKLKTANAIEMAEAMPAGKYDFKPTPEMRPFGELMVHLAGSNYFFAAGAAGEKPPAEGRFQGEHTKENVVAFMRKAFEYAAGMVETIGDDRAGEVIPVFGSLKATRRKTCEFMLDHVTHHLGYSVPYLRMAGVTKIPAYRFTGGDRSPM